jgi:hypothetical protein
MKLEWPQMVYIGLTLMGLGSCMANHGKQKTTAENFFITCIAQSIHGALLYYGGFFG